MQMKSLELLADVTNIINYNLEIAWGLLCVCMCMNVCVCVCV